MFSKKGSSYPGKVDPAVSAAGALGGLLVVVSHQPTTGGLHDLRLVGRRVVGMAPGVGNAPVAANHLRDNGSAVRRQNNERADTHERVGVSG